MISTLVSMMHEFDWATAGGNSLPVAGAFAGAYLVMVVAFVSSKSLREGCKFEFPKKCIPYHNLFLSIASLIMFAGTLFYTIERVQKNGWEWLLCDTCSEAKGPLWFFSYLYYLSKYYELLDTVLQFFSGKMPPNLFLHVYHHALILVSTWLWIETRSSVQFFGIMSNTFVHVIMYYYYYCRSTGVIPKWKNWVTRTQIIQFMFSLVLAIGATSIMLYRWYTGITQCNGVAVFYGQIVFNITLLSGFWDILSRSMKMGKDKGDKKKK